MTSLTDQLVNFTEPKIWFRREKYLTKCLWEMKFLVKENFL